MLYCRSSAAFKLILFMSSKLTKMQLEKAHQHGVQSSDKSVLLIVINPPLSNSNIFKAIVANVLGCQNHQ